MTGGRLRGVGAALLAAIFLLPIAVLVAGALHAPGAPLPRDLGLLPSAPSLDALDRALELVPLGRQLGNSALVVLVAVPLSVLVASWAGYAMTRLPPRARHAAVGLALVLLVVPASAVWTPRFVLVSELGLTDSLIGLMLPALMGTTPFAVLLFFWSFRRIEPELIDAARLEGLGPLTVWRRVAMPLVRPTTAAVAVIVFVVHWGNFVDALLYLYTPETFTLPLGMSQLRLLGPNDQATILAGALVVAAPAMLAFVLVQRRFLGAFRGAGWVGR